MHAQHADDLCQAGRGGAEAARVAQRADTAAQKRAHHVCGGRVGGVGCFCPVASASRTVCEFVCPRVQIGVFPSTIFDSGVAQYSFCSCLSILIIALAIGLYYRYCMGKCNNKADAHNPRGMCARKRLANFQAPTTGSAAVHEDSALFLGRARPWTRAGGRGTCRAAPLLTTDVLCRAGFTATVPPPPRPARSSVVQCGAKKCTLELDFCHSWQ